MGKNIKLKDEELMITLYPTNWLYNAGVIGFLQCLERDDYLESNKLTRYNFKNNLVEINNHVFEYIKVDDNYFENGNIVNLRGANSYYKNFIDTSGKQKKVFRELIKAFSNNKLIFSNICSMCSNSIYVDKNQIYINNIDEQANIDNFFNKIENLSMSHNIILGGSIKKFPNAYWNINNKFKICHLCSFILIHHHLAFIKLSDNSEIFINAPSFKVMYEMNKLAKEIFGKSDVSERQKREILAMSIIEYSRKLNLSLGMWEQMNIEIIIKSKNGIDTFSLPSQTVNLISDRQIASMLSEIGEFSVLNVVLNGEIDKLLNMGYKFIRIGLKKNNELNKSDKKYINYYIFKDKNKIDLTNFAQKILKLYTAIIERRKIYD